MPWLPSTHLQGVDLVLLLLQQLLACDLILQHLQDKGRRHSQGQRESDTLRQRHVGACCGQSQGPQHNQTASIPLACACISSAQNQGMQAAQAQAQRLPAVSPSPGAS